MLDTFINTEHDTKITPAKSGVAEAFLRMSKEIRNGNDYLDNLQIGEVKSIFTSIYETIEKNGYEFAYRTVKEIKQYLNAAFILSAQWDFKKLYNAIDEQVLQKVLPKIHGNRKEIGNMLDELENICKSDNVELRLSGRKIEQMKGKLAAVQYASFI